MNIDKMSASREMDAIIAERVMKWKRVEISGEAWADVHNQWHDDYMGSKDGIRTVVPLYSSNVSSVFQVVEKFERGFKEDQVAAVIEMIVLDTLDEENYYCAIYSPSLAKVEAMGKSLPEAICRAA